MIPNIHKMINLNSAAFGLIIDQFMNFFALWPCNIDCEPNALADFKTRWMDSFVLSGLAVFGCPFRRLPPNKRILAGFLPSSSIEVCLGLVLISFWTLRTAHLFIRLSQHSLRVIYIKLRAMSIILTIFLMTDDRLLSQQNPAKMWVSEFKIYQHQRLVLEGPPGVGLKHTLLKNGEALTSWSLSWNESSSFLMGNRSIDS